MKTCLTILLFISFSAKGQELFPHSEPASTIPKGVIGIRVFGESFKEINTQRNMGAVRIMYGLTPKLSIYISASASNHHGKNLPANLVTHTHIGNQHIYFAQNIQKGLAYPYLFNGFNFFAKYRFLSIDGEKKHFRMATYGEFSNVQQAHDEAEPDLLEDTKGYGAGLMNNLFKKALRNVIYRWGNYSRQL